MPGAQAGPSFPAARQTQQGACPGEGWGELSPPLPDMGMPHASHAADPGILGSQERGDGFPKGSCDASPTPRLGASTCKVSGGLGQDAGEEATARGRQQ